MPVVLITQNVRRVAVRYCVTEPKECTCKKNCNESTNNKTTRKKRTGDDRSRF